MLDNKNDRDSIEAAILFYYKINKMTELELRECNFSRNEILSGLIKISKMCNLDDVFTYIDNLGYDSETDMFQ